MPDDYQRVQPGQRFHRNRFRPTPFMDVVQASAPPATDAAARLTAQSIRRRHSLHEYGSLASSAGQASSSSEAQSLPAHQTARRQWYFVDWAQDSPLGITFHRRVTHDTVVKTATHPNVAVGDTLVAINGLCVQGLEYSETMEALRQVRKPATLTFSRNTDASAARQPLTTNSLGGQVGANEGEARRLQRVQSDGMFEFLSQFERRTRFDDGATTVVTSDTHLSTASSVCTLAHCLCASCSAATPMMRRHQHLTASTIETFNIDAFDGMSATALSASSSFVSTVSGFDRLRDPSPRRPPAALPLRVSTATMTNVATFQDAATMTDFDAPSAPDMNVPFADAVVVVTNVPMATPVVEKSAAGQATAGGSSPPAAAPSPPVTGLGPFVSHLLSNLTAPNQLRQPRPAPNASAALPSTGRAASSSQPRPHSTSYSVEWSSPSLGLVLQRVRDSVVVAEVTAAASDTSTEFAVHDKLVAVNGIRVADVGFHHAVQLLQALSKPIVLSFRRSAKAPTP